MHNSTPRGRPAHARWLFVVALILSGFFVPTTQAANQPPSISGKPPSWGYVGSQYNFIPTASDPEGATLRFYITNKPSWAAFNSYTGRLAGTPGAPGLWTNIQIRVTDGTHSVWLPAFALRAIMPWNSPPKLSGTPPASVVVGTAYRFVPTASDANGDTLKFSITNKPAWAWFNNLTGQLGGKPAASHVGTYSNIVIKASDGKASTSLPAFHITVTDTGTSTGSATLSWTPPTLNTDGSALSNLAGYRIYYGTSTSALNRVITINNAGVSRYVVDDLSPATWYFAVRAYTSAGVQSSNSRVVSKTIQ